VVGDCQHPVGATTESLGFVKGEKVEVWSNSKAAWCDALVVEAFSVQSVADGFAVPAGSVKVSFDSGVKFIMPEQVSAMLRKSGTSVAASRFVKGAKLQVWSESQGAWVDAVVEEAFAEATNFEGFAVPAGMLKVRSATSVKWVRPEQAWMVREVGTGACAQLLSRDPGFAKGEKIQVWSDSRQLWLGGVVLEAFATAGTADGFTVPAGTLKVSSDAGVKWVSPALASKILRKVDLCGSVAAPDLKAVLAELLQDPVRLKRHVEALWAATAAAGRADQGLLPRERVAWALEGLALQLDLQLELEGRHQSLVEQRLDAFDADGDGHLTQNEFQELSRQIINEVWTSL